jgi:urease accessory protein
MSLEIEDVDSSHARVARLEAELHVAKSQLAASEAKGRQVSSDSTLFGRIPINLPFGPSIHNLLLLADSALPLGSFAYSNGLESFLAHHKPLPIGATQISLFQKFLGLSVQSLAFTTVPYVLAAFRDPLALMDLDNDLDASTTCTVARRASVAQGRALLSVWDKSLAAGARTAFPESVEAPTVIEMFAKDLEEASHGQGKTTVNGHLGPLWGVVCLALGLNLEESAYLFLLNHAKAILSAAVRASVMGPYLAQNILAGHQLQEQIRKCLESVWLTRPEDAGQVVPMLDIWIGRHEMLYSKLFNS